MNVISHNRLNWKQRGWALLLGGIIAANVILFRVTPDSGQPFRHDVKALPVNTDIDKARAASWLVDASEGQGTAVAVRLPGRTRLVTAAHVVGQDKTVWLRQPLRANNFLNGEIRVKARVIKANHWLDVAFLEPVDESVFQSVAIRDAKYLRVGLEIVHIGNLYGETFPLSVTTGKVTGHEAAPDTHNGPWLPGKTDVAALLVEPGSSGGGVFVDGKLVGIVVGKAGQLAFFVPTHLFVDALYVQ